MKKLNLIEMSTDELITLINQGIQNQLKELQDSILNNNQNSKELLSREEACELLNIDKTTLWRWTKKGKIQSYGLAGKRYYKRNEILKSLKKNT